MKRITAYLRPYKLEEVKTAVANLPITGMTITDVRGTGNSPERSSWFAGEQHLIALPLRSKLVIVVTDDLVDDVLNCIQEHARTGEPGDGKITVEQLSDVIRIRTNERGETAI